MYSKNKKYKILYINIPILIQGEGCEHLNNVHCYYASEGISTLLAAEGCAIASRWIHDDGWD